MDLEARLREHASDAGVVGAALGISIDGETSVAVHGVADPDTGEPLTTDTVFQIASVTKPMVATVLAYLATHGRLSFDDPAPRWIPELHTAPWAERITLRDLLANRSGVPLTSAREFAFPNDDDDCLARFADDVARDPPMAAPGSLWGYCNTGWSLLARAIETATGLVWERAMQELLFEPLGMRTTDFHHMPATGLRGSPSFLRAGEDLQRGGLWPCRALGAAGATVRSTVGDLLHFAAPHVAGDSDLTGLRVEHASVTIAGYLDAWCLGWARFDWPGGPVWGWDGISSGFRTVLRFVPGRGAIALTANTSTGRGLYRALFPQLMERLGVDMPPLDLTPRAAGRLDRFDGTYGWSDRTVTVRAEGDRLAFTVGEDVVSADGIGGDAFVLDPDGPLTVTFARPGDDGRPQLLYWLVWPIPRISPG